MREFVAALHKLFTLDCSVDGDVYEEGGGGAG